MNGAYHHLRHQIRSRCAKPRRLGSMNHAPAVHVQSRVEELANALSHGLALLLALVAVPWLIHFTVMHHSTRAVVGVCVFGVTVILAYLSSTIYHALPHGQTKQTFRTLDHMSIYLLIAGTYTPFTLGVLSGAWGWSLLAAIWTLAALGIVIKARSTIRHSHVSTLFYLAMGWLVVVAIVPLWQNMSAAGLSWLVAGGLAYTVGTFFYAKRSLPFAHLIWHLFVMTGTSCHFVAVSFYAAA